MGSTDQLSVLAGARQRRRLDPRQIVDSRMRSDEHRDNVLGSWQIRLDVPLDQTIVSRLADEITTPPATATSSCAAG
jgi:hypothetical protein